MISVYKPTANILSNLKNIREKTELFFNVKHSPFNSQNSHASWGASPNACFVYNGRIYSIRTQDLNPLFLPQFEITDDPKRAMSEAAAWAHVAKLNLKRQIVASKTPGLPIQTGMLKVTGKAFQGALEKCLDRRLKVPMFEIKQANRKSNVLKGKDCRGALLLDNKFNIKFRSSPHRYADIVNSKQFIEIIHGWRKY